MVFKRSALEAVTIFPVGMYIGVWPLFKYLQHNKKNGKNKKHSEMWYSLVFSSVYKLGERPLRELKEKLFGTLHQVESVNEELKAKGQVRVLEIGPGFGGNFKFYPANTLLTTVEIKSFLEKDFDKVQKQFPNISLERSIIGNAENMSQVPDNSLDVVVGTLILCCIDDFKAALNEIHRVLAKGGKFYFMESVTHPEGTFKRKVQRLYKPFWHGFTLGCKAGAFDIKTELETIGFGSLDYHEETIKTLPILLSRFHYGIATK